MIGKSMHTSAHSPARIEHAEWLVRDETQAIFTALSAEGHGVRIVGGAVRNALMRVPVKDVDFATTAVPHDVMRLARAAGLSAHPTGIDHGTITIVANHHPYEVTTLRRDIETFGRHASVTFTSDWREDAARRDFTINALYCDRDGAVIDPLGGYPDLVARRIRFIGAPADRIREDYLRILRFFRFTAEYAHGEPDPEGLAACVAHRDGLRRLSGERIRNEILRLLIAPGVVPALEVMNRAGILEVALQQQTTQELRTLARLAAIEAARRMPPDPMLRLSALAAPDVPAAAALARQLKLSSAEAARLEAIAGGWSRVPAPDDEASLKALLYRVKPRLYTDFLLLAWARSRYGDGPSDETRTRAQSLPERWQAPDMPFRGADLLARGIPPGRLVGEILESFESWWVSAGFPSDPDRQRIELQRIIRAVS